MKTITLGVAVATLLAGPALAQGYYGAPYGYDPRPPRAFLSGPNNTGGAVNVIVPYGALGADTFQSNSAVAGNQARPELAVPNGSGGSGATGR